MNRFFKSAALAVGLSLLGTAAMACGADCCAKDKDGKMTCCDKMKGDRAAPKPGAQTPAAPQGGDHQDHQH